MMSTRLMMVKHNETKAIRVVLVDPESRVQMESRALLENECADGRPLSLYFLHRKPMPLLWADYSRHVTIMRVEGPEDFKSTPLNKFPELEPASAKFDRNEKDLEDRVRVIRVAREELEAAPEPMRHADRRLSDEQIQDQVTRALWWAGKVDRCHRMHEPKQAEFCEKMREKNLDAKDPRDKEAIKKAYALALSSIGAEQKKTASK